MDDQGNEKDRESQKEKTVEVTLDCSRTCGRCGRTVFGKPAYARYDEARGRWVADGHLFPRWGYFAYTRKSDDASPFGVNVCEECEEVVKRALSVDDEHPFGKKGR